MWWIVRLLSVLVIGLLSLALAGGVYQALAALADNRNYPPPGQLVDVGGYRLHIYCLGEGTPTVILEGGAGEASPMWGWIQPEVARTTRVCAYDRAGFGWSDNNPQPREAQQIVRELHILLNNAGIEPPYVLVGHSFGGGLARLYTQQHPGQVVGLVLIDSRHPDQVERIPELQQLSAFGRQLSMAGQLSAPFGLMRLYWGEAGPNPDLPPLQKAQMRAFYATARTYRTQLQEDSVMAQSDAQVRATGQLGAVPLIVLSQDTTGDWMVLQEELSELSSSGQWRVVDGSTHISLLTDPKHAAETGAAIQQLVEASRSK